MDLLRAHADAIITGIHTLVEETLSAPKLNEGRGPVYRIEDPSLRDLRSKLRYVKFLGSYPAAGEHGPSLRRDADAAWKAADQWITSLRDQVRR